MIPAAIARGADRLEFPGLEAGEDFGMVVLHAGELAGP
jgi:hypothetical protein